jgi:hypothetical protein
LAEDRPRFEYDPLHGTAAAAANRAWLIRTLFLTRTGRRVLAALAILVIAWLALR